MLTILPLITLFTLSEITCYTLLGPKLYSQSLPANNRPWSNVVPYPFRTYQPSIPVPYYGRYVGDPYFAPNIQNPDYYFSQDNYPYSSSFDDPDYYSNFLYYIPTSRRIPYYDQPPVDPIDEIQDYDEVAPEDENIPKPQRDWWLEKNVMPNEDTDFTDFNLLDDIPMIATKDAKMPKKVKSKTKESKKKTQNRYIGIDGFGRIKDKEQIYGTYRPSPRRDEERTWVYGVPARSDYTEDEDVRELRSLLKEPKDRNGEYDNSDLANWIVGNAKRSSDVKNSHSNENSSKVVSTLRPNVFPVYNQAGIENFPIDYNTNDRWSRDENEPEEPSVFDQIKRLLALEDKVSQQIKSKRSEDCDSESCEYRSEKESRVQPQVETTTMKMFPNIPPLSVLSSTKKPEIKNRKRSAEKPNESLVSDEESLVRQLSALRHMRS